MRYQGRLQDWNDDKGYGFVLPNGGGDRAFVHIKAFEQRSQRPSNGMLINYQLRTDERGRLNAIAVRSATASKAAVAPKRAAATARLPHVSLGVGALLGLFGLWIVKLVPDWTLFAVLGMSVVALGFYLHDKGAAARGEQRVPENTLHLLSLLGGWPGALIGQGLFRHKTSKQSFQFVFWLTVVLNIGAIVLIASGKIALPQ